MRRLTLPLMALAMMTSACGPKEKGAAAPEPANPTPEQKAAAQKVKIRATPMANLDFEGGLDSTGLPVGWGGGGLGYQFSVVTDSPHFGKGSFALKWNKSIAPDSNDWATLTQCNVAADWQGKRVQFSGFMKSAGVDSGAGLWLRVDTADVGPPVAFDNMLDRPMKGTTDWKEYSVVLDVDAKATKICYGVVMTDRGSVWADDLSLKAVGKEVPVTGQPPKPE